jgi:hypothetical protein
LLASGTCLCPSAPLQHNFEPRCVDGSLDNDPEAVILVCAERHGHLRLWGNLERQLNVRERLSGNPRL